MQYLFLKQVVKLKPWEQKAPTLILKTYSYAVRIRILWIKASFPSLPLIWLCLLSKLSKRVKTKLKGGVERGLLCVSFVFPISDLSLPTPWRPKPRVRCSFEIYSFLAGIVVEGLIPSRTEVSWMLSSVDSDEWIHWRGLPLLTVCLPSVSVFLCKQ